MCHFCQKSISFPTFDLGKVTPEISSLATQENLPNTVYVMSHFSTIFIITFLRSRKWNVMSLSLPMQKLNFELNLAKKTFMCQYQSMSANWKSSQK